MDTHLVQVRLPHTLAEQAKRLADEQERSLAGYTRWLLKREIAAEQTSSEPVSTP
jgi:hypothetical protein